MSSPGMIVLKSGDGTEHEVSRTVALKSVMIKYHMDVDPGVSSISIPNINSHILDKVIHYCTKHVEAALNPQNQSPDEVAEELRQWDANFLDVNDVTLFKLLVAASFLNIEDLLDLTCNAFLDMISAMIKAEGGEVINDNDA
ncbi:hypothetical protein K2173_023450 [Erythroxylum novogranatense]|uniref:SKP1-like protein n=1 Tax=Erythroxylum novogranatense TaxID=1862640 RepID=A0AAV8TY56_9ROSI|nr:hypothetical protein K2173_023450 [Erythroxylum novogranatense]